MADQQKRKGRKTIPRRAFYEEELEPLEIERGETLDELFLTFIKAKELERLGNFYIGVSYNAKKWESMNKPAMKRKTK